MMPALLRAREGALRVGREEEWHEEREVLAGARGAST